MLYWRKFFVFRIRLLSGKQCYAPKILDKENMDLYPIFSAEDLIAFPKNKWGIAEPPTNDRKGVLDDVSSELLDLILIPGVAFDPKNARLGKGKGYYDRFLNAYFQKVSTLQGQKPVLVGLAFSEQIVDSVPTDPHDVFLDVVISP